MRILFLFLALLLPGFAPAEAQETKALRILADSSLAPAMTVLSREYSAVHGVALIVTYDAAAELMRRIEEGEAADAVIVDHPLWLEKLRQKGLVDIHSEQTIAHNKLVVALPGASLLIRRMPKDANLTDLLAWLKDRTFLVLADPETTSLGLYTQEILERLQIPQEKMKRLQASNSQQAAYFTAENNAAGILYASDVPYQQGLKVVAEISGDLHDPVEYRAAVVAGENMKLARQFLAFLQEDRAQTVFRRHGL